MEPRQAAKPARIKRLFATGNAKPVKIRQDSDDSSSKAQPEAQTGQAQKEAEVITSHNHAGKD